jgi:hypothetical protein
MRSMIHSCKKRKGREKVRKGEGNRRENDKVSITVDPTQGEYRP